MFLRAPQHITDHEEALRLAGVEYTFVDDLKAHVKDIGTRDKSVAAPHNTIEKIDRAVRNVTKEMDRIDPEIRDKMQEFAIRYHAYITDHEAVIAADDFKKDLIAALRGIPEIEAVHIANKIITAVGSTKKMSAEDIYREVLVLIKKNPKNTKQAEIFHAIIDFYIDKLVSDGTIEQDENAKAWTALDQLARIFTTHKEFLYHAKPEKLNRKGKAMQRALRAIVKGIQMRKTNIVREGIQAEFIKTDEVGTIIDQHLWEIEQRTH
ncbi:MAG: hypothetical protein NTX63_05620 [Candidatus Peregrinibacteria bacterium]|nr:hypothetical protein [Candidatus Peregrinibacteria bacterium]